MEQQLALLAELSVGLAGFSSVIVVFRRGGSEAPWKPEDVFRFRIMLESSLMAGLFAILPVALQSLGVPVSLLWRIGCALLGSYLLSNIWMQSRAVARLPARSLSPLLRSLIAVSNIVAAGVQVLGVTGWLLPRGPGPYVFGVSWLTVYAGMMFYRLVTAPIVVVEQPQGRAPGRDG